MSMYEQLTASYQHDDDVVFDTEDGVRTRAEVRQLVARMGAALIDAGLEPGDRVVLQADKSVEVLCIYLACLRFGFVLVPLNTAYTSAELAYFVEDAQPMLAILAPGIQLATTADVQVLTLDGAGGGSFMRRVGAASADQPARKPAVEPSQPAVVIYTSGTTGRSKGAVLSHANLASNATSLAEAWGFSDQDVLLHTLPLFHVHGLFVAVNTAMVSGARIRLRARFSPADVCRELPGCSVFMGVPTYYTRLLDDPSFTRQCCQSVRLFVSGSAPLLAETFARFRHASGHEIVERYGMSETNILTSNPLVGERLPGTVGFALQGTTLRIADDRNQNAGAGEVGSVQVKGPGVFSGYWRRSELNASEFTADGFFRTGDLGSIDLQGRLTLQGRHKDLVISGGLNVYPAEIEQFLDALPGVRESAVVGVADADFGERVEAFIVADAGQTGLPALLEQAARQGLANFKRPKAYHLIDILPRNTMGKVQKDRLRRRLGSE